MAKLSKDDILKSVENMSVLELADLVKALEEKFGVSAMPVAAASQPSSVPPSGTSEGQAEEQTVFNVVLSAAGENKIGVIKAVRELVQTLGLQDAKALVESAPKEVLTGVGKAAAQEAKKKLETAGAKVELK